jgi:hypothetical protein
VTGFVDPWSEVSTMKGVYCINKKRFYIVLRVAGVILFFGLCRSKMWIRKIIQLNVLLSG